MANIDKEGFGLVVSLFMIMLILECAAVVRPANHHHSVASAEQLNRTSFPPGFIFGAGSASYQFEGGAREGGKGPSIWDTYTHKYPGKIKDHSNGDVADDSYHRYKEDVGLLKEMRMDAYRFSISWPRLLPGGKLRRGVNNEGIQYYNNLINELLANGMQPFVTLFHWDLPQALEDDYGGFLSPHIVDDFRDYAGLCYEKFGDRVKHWVTVNEAWAFSVGGYTEGTKAPGRCSKWEGNCSAGNSGTEPYTVSHHLLLAHAAAVREYKEKYQASQKGNIGITLVSHWFLPFSKDKSNKDAAQRALDFMFGWYLDPITYGDYPDSMRSLVGDRLPKFSEEESEMLKGSFDFLGINYYTSNYAANISFSNSFKKSYTTDNHANCTTQRNGKPIGPQTGAAWQFICPKGIRDLLIYTKKKYNNPVMYIAENGMGEFNNNSLTLEEALKDDLRASFHQRHLLYVQRAIIEDGVDVRGYFVWSLLDNFEWSSGYTVRFGINYVDYKDGLKRYPKQSAIWFKKFLQK